MNWEHVFVNQTQPKKNCLVEKLKVTSFPTTILIAPHGKIIARNKTMSELKKILKMPCNNITFYKFNCGFCANFQHSNPHQFCAHADGESDRNPQCKLIIYCYATAKNPKQQINLSKNEEIYIRTYDNSNNYKL